jgi:hypothetical protein
MTPATNSLVTAITAAILAMIIVGAAAYESIAHDHIDPALIVMATAVVATFFTGQAVRQVNGAKVDALTQSVIGLHTRLDSAGVGPAKDGAPTP